MAKVAQVSGVIRARARQPLSAETLRQGSCLLPLPSLPALQLSAPCPCFFLNPRLPRVLSNTNSN
eukprot:1654350-Pleurochrysis_carterae.AAC.1